MAPPKKNKKERTYFYTTAGEEYDGFGTETEEVLGDWHGKTLRYVSTPNEHVNWQMNRNYSGNYYSSFEPPYNFKFKE